MSEFMTNYWPILAGGLAIILSVAWHFVKGYFDKTDQITDIKDKSLGTSIDEIREAVNHNREDIEKLKEKRFVDVEALGKEMMRAEKVLLMNDNNIKTEFNGKLELAISAIQGLEKNLETHVKSVEQSQNKMLEMIKLQSNMINTQASLQKQIINKLSLRIDGAA